MGASETDYARSVSGESPMEVGFYDDDSASRSGSVGNSVECLGHCSAYGMCHAGRCRNRHGAGIYPPSRRYAYPHAGVSGSLRGDDHQPDALCSVPGLRRDAGSRPTQCTGHYRYRLPGCRNHSEGGAHHQGPDHCRQYLGGGVSGHCRGCGLLCRGSCGRRVHDDHPDRVRVAAGAAAAEQLRTV